VSGVLLDEVEAVTAVPPQAEPGPALRRRTATILLVVTVLGAAWRLLSFGYNVWPHGDVVIDAAIAESVAWQGRLLVPFVDVRYYPIERFGFGYPPDQHPPLWPLLGAPLVALAGDGYAALKVASLLVGIVCVPMTYLALRRRVGEAPALLASGLVAGSYPMVDFSGNGSLWVLLAALYLVWVWALPPPADWQEGLREWRRWAVVGLAMGLGYLTNYPAVVLPIALLVLHLLRHGRGAMQRRALAGPAVSALVMLAVVLPWLLYNAALFGSPIWSQPFQRTLAGGSRQVEYVLVNGEAVKRNLPATGDWRASLRERAADFYGNVGFVVKQSLVLTPVLGGLFLVGLLLLAPPLPRKGEGAVGRPEGRGPMVGEGGRGLRVDPLPVAVLAVTHLVLILCWPTTKFRYLVPLLPLTFALGAWCLWQVRPDDLRARLAVVVVGLCLFTNAWTMLSIPSRTYYYDGGLVGDNFGQQGERLFVEETQQYRDAADAIRANGPGVVLGDHILAPLTRMPLVVNSTGYAPEIVRHLVEKHAVRYIVSDRAHADAYGFLGVQPVWSGERFVVLEVPSR
jgi:4-amino-4-deoxy-L-arabinose transferase-like glycosyltransferase